MLPGDVLELQSHRCWKNDVLRRRHNNNFAFGRFIWSDMSFIADSSGRTNRSRHFETRLHAHLPWSATSTNGGEKDIDGAVVLVTPISRRIRRFKELLPTAFCHIEEDAGYVDYLYIHPETWKRSPHPSESLCIDLELFFKQAGYYCPCCSKDVPLRCDYCLNAVGWHRCRHNLDCESADHVSWCPGTLWKTGTEDVFACVVQMLRDAVDHRKILAMLKSLFENQCFTEEYYNYLQTYVLFAAAKIVDNDPMHPVPSHSMVMSHASQKEAQISPDALRAKIEYFANRMASLWSHSAFSIESTPMEVFYVGLQKNVLRCDANGIVTGRHVYVNCEVRNNNRNEEIVYDEN